MYMYTHECLTHMHKAHAHGWWMKWHDELMNSASYSVALICCMCSYLKYKHELTSCGFILSVRFSNITGWSWKNATNTQRTHVNLFKVSDNFDKIVHSTDMRMDYQSYSAHNFNVYYIIFRARVGIFQPWRNPSFATLAALCSYMSSRQAQCTRSTRTPDITWNSSDIPEMPHTLFVLDWVFQDFVDTWDNPGMILWLPWD